MGFIFTLIAAAIIISGILIGFLKGWKKTVVGLGIAVISFIMALAISNPISQKSSSELSPIINDAIVDSIGQEAFDQLTEDSKTSSAMVEQLPGALITPIVMCVLFILIFVLLSCFSPLISRAIFRKKEDETPEEKRKRKLLGIPLGFAKGFLLAFVIMLPIAGYIRIIANVLPALELDKGSDNADGGADNQQVLDIIDNYVLPITNDPFLKLTNTLGGKAIFNSQTRIKIDGKKYSLSKTVDSIITIVSDSSPFFDSSPKEYSKLHADALDRVVDDLTSDPLTVKLGSELISGASKAWLDGKAFVSVSRPTIDGFPGKIFDSMLGIYSTMTTDTMHSDVQLFADIFRFIIENDVIKNIDPDKMQESILDILSQDGFVSDFVVILSTNERMNPVLNEITGAGVFLIANTVGIPADGYEVRNNLITGITDSLNETLKITDKDERSALLLKKLKETFSKNGVDFPDDVMPQTCECILSSLGDSSEIKEENISELFVEIAAEFSEYSDVELNVTDRIPNQELKNNLTNLKDSIIKDGNTQDVVKSFSTVSTNIANGKVDTTLITAEQIASKVGTITVENSAAEAKYIENIAKSASKILEDLNSAENSNDIINNLNADALQEIVIAMKSSDTLGDATKDLLNGVMENSSGNGVLDSSIVDDMLNNPDNVANTIQTAQKTVDIINSLSDDLSNSETKKENLRDDIGWLVENMTPDTSSLIKKQLSDEKMLSLGINEERAASVNLVVNSLLDSMSEESKLDNDELQKESDAIVHLYDITVNLSDSDSTSSSDLANNAEDVVSTILDSKVISSAISKIAYNDDTTVTDPLNIGEKFTDKQKTMFVDALNDYSVQKNSSETKERVIALSTILNIQIDVASDGTVTAK